MKILIVEDDYISRRLLCRYLEPYVECFEAVNGNEAVDSVRYALDAGSHFDLICLDIMMPGMDGQESLSAIRLLEAANGLPLGQGSRIVMTSAMEEEKFMLDAFSASADGYLVKPIERRKLLATLKDAGLELDPVYTSAGV